jgi:hypothetical protein
MLKRRVYVLTALLGVLVALLSAVALVLFFERQVTLTFLNPDRAYEAYSPPPPGDYREPDAWFVHGRGGDQPAAFVIHTNAFRSAEDWNAPLHDTQQETFLAKYQVAADIAPFDGWSSLYVPRYRQPTMFARFTQKHPGTASRMTAYNDIEAAFDAFVADIGPERPVVLAGYDDGALLLGRLWLERIADDEKLRSRIVAAYAIGLPLSRAAFQSDVCQASTDIRCLLGFTPVDERFGAYQERLRTRTLIMSKRGRFVGAGGTAKLCAPPPLEESVAAYAAKTNETLSLEHGGQCKDGLFVHAPPPKPMRRATRFGGPWYPNATNLFAGAIATDAQQRLQSFEAVQLVESIADEVARQRSLLPPPIEAAEDLRSVPINKVPGGL